MGSAEYIPGTCNIGRAEIRQRQVVALIGLALSLFSLIGFISTHADQQVRLGIFLPLSIASIGWVQSRKKFCLAFGFMGTFNFSRIGQMSKVLDKSALKTDRITAAKILLQSLAISAALTAVIYFLPL